MGEMNLVSIIVPTYNRLDFLQRCVESIRTHTSDVPYQLIVVDNASSDGTSEWCIRQKIPFLSLPHPERFCAACDIGFRMADGDTFLLMKHDTVVTPNWLRNLVTALYSQPDIGIVGPVSNRAGGSQHVDYPFQDLDEFQRIAAVVNVSDSTRWKEVKHVESFCLAFRREVMDRIGHGDDYGLQARKAGYKLVVCHDVLLYHEG
ncbi:glycosyltransferase [Cohnella pontilimi]|uniref:Glycosyltransferase n=1 Tax=Cohnella pontilimi TaxID=2564100 RepID=A0A4U0F552_9BACL|nr:glycosyltransferase [Cohnella pontilimi]TJY39747.1 glycosyltransferase [Cohnella pontilimi]